MVSTLARLPATSAVRGAPLARAPPAARVAGGLPPCITHTRPRVGGANRVTGAGLRAAAPAAWVRRTSSVAAMAADPKTVLVPVADGCEEMEAVIVIDVLVRAGAKVTVASVDGPVVTCSRGVQLQADTLLADAAAGTYDLIAVPGGMPGAEHFRDCAQLIDMIREQKESGRLYAAICASPAVVLEHHGLLSGQPATSHPAFQDRLSNQGSVKERVVEVGTLTTSQGPGTAFEFALSLVRQLYGAEKMKEIAGPMVMYPAAVLDSAN